MKIKLKFFGQLAEITGTANIEVAEINDTDSLTKKMLIDCPRLKDFKFQISVNKKLVQKNQELETGSEVAFLPPFAGG